MKHFAGDGPLVRLLALHLMTRPKVGATLIGAVIVAVTKALGVW